MASEGYQGTQPVALYNKRNVNLKEMFVNLIKEQVKVVDTFLAVRIFCVCVLLP